MIKIKINKVRQTVTLIIPFFISILLLLSNVESLCAANNNWIQSDWSGGADTAATAQHPGDQTGWAKYYSRGPNVNTSIPGQVLLTPQITSLTQTADIQDFDRGSLTNLRIVGNGNYLNTYYEVDSPGITWAGAWTLGWDNSGRGWYKISATTSSAATFTFTGTNVTWIGRKGNSFGIAYVYLDNVLQQSVDLYNPAMLYQQALWSVTGLPNTSHTIKVVVSGFKNGSSSGKNVIVDDFLITSPNPDNGAYLAFVDGRRSFFQTGDSADFDRGSLTNLTIVGNGDYVNTYYEVDSPGITWAGAWTLGWDNNGRGWYKISSTNSSSATLTFTGTGVTWIGRKGNSFGIAYVYLDDVLQQSVDLYNPAILYQQALWSVTGLSNTSHTIKIVVSGARNGSSSGSNVDVDDFDVTVPYPDTAAYLMLVDNVSAGTYESPVVDTGAGGAQLYSISWNALPLPAGSTLRFQIASNNDNTTWIYTGPDGTVNTYYETTGATIHSSHNGRRYFKYKALFDRLTLNPADSPILNDVTISYGLINLLSGVYESPSFDVGVGGGYFSSISWNAVVPAGSGLKYQIATNNDNLTWSYLGPDGTSATYYQASGEAIHTVHSGKRYIKFKAFFSRLNADPVNDVKLNDITIYYGLNPPLDVLVSSLFDTMDDSNVVRRLAWSENIPVGTDLFLQIRTSPDGITWEAWLGPHSTTFSAASGVSQLVVATTEGLSAGSRVTLTNSANPNQMEVKTISAINTASNTVTLDTATSYTYAVNSVFSDSYTVTDGTEYINNQHKTGSNDRWIQYRLFLSTIYGAVTPTFYENEIAYLTAAAVYQPDTLIDGNGNDLYGAAGTGDGGGISKNIAPGFKLLTPLTFDIRVQNDGSAESADDTYKIIWNTPSDISGAWTVLLNDGVNDLTSPLTVPIAVGVEKTYTLKVNPSAYAPGGSVQDIIMNVHSVNEYNKVDSIKATVAVVNVFQADGLIDNSGNNIYDSSRAGNGGSSLLKEAIPGDKLQYTITLQNEGNTPDTYTFSLQAPPPSGWTVLINDGSKDIDITNPSGGWTTPSIRALPYTDSEKTYTLKVIPKGVAATTDLILNIYSNGSGSYLDSLMVKAGLKGVYRVDGVVYGFAYNGAGNVDYSGANGAGCGNAGAGDHIYGATGSGNGGCAGVDIFAGSVREITLGVSNEGSLTDRYALSWQTPGGWTIVVKELRTNGTIIEYDVPPLNIPTGLTEHPVNYLPGERVYVTFKITSPSGFVFGSQPAEVVIDIVSLGDNTKADSVKLIINSKDTTPPSPVVLNQGNIGSQSVTITWTAPGDDGMTGTASLYDLRYSESPVVTDTEFNNAQRVLSCKNGESNLGKPKASGSSESCTASGFFANTDYYFAIKSTDDSGNTSVISTCTSCPFHTLVSSDATPPGTITDLSVTGSSKDTITLCWTAKADDGSVISSDVVTAYDLRYSRRQIVEDSVTPGIGEIVFSNAIQLTPSGGFLPPKSSGMQECYIVPVENKINLGGGIIDDRTQNTRFYFAVKSIDEARNNSSISNVPGGMTTLVSNAYNMISIPYTPPVLNSSPADVFGDDVGSQLFVYGWDSRGPNWDNGCYNGWPLPHNLGNEICTQLTSVAEGSGYFLWVPAGNIALDVPLASTLPVVQDCTDDTLPVPSHFPCYIMTLQDGWNMIGSPFDKEINLSSNATGGITERGLYIRKTVSGNTEVVKFQDAVTAKSWLNSSVYTSNGTTYTYETCNLDGCSLVFQPWKAYWIRVYGGGSSVYELLVPN